MLTVILLVVALVLVLLRSAGVNPVRPHLGWLGLALVILAWIIGAWPGATA